MIYNNFIFNLIPLSQNSRHRKSSNGTTWFSNYRTNIRSHLKSNVQSRGKLTQTLYGKVVYIHKSGDLYYKKRDADNISKPLWDTLNSYAFDDDSQIKHRIACAFDVNNDNPIQINISKLNTADSIQFINFFSGTNTDSKLLYIEIGDLNYSNVQFG